MKRIYNLIIFFLLLTCFLLIDILYINAQSITNHKFSGLLTVLFEDDLDKEERHDIVEKSIDNLYLMTSSNSKLVNIKGLPDSILTSISVMKNEQRKLWDNNDEALRHRGFTILWFAFTWNTDSSFLHSISIGFSKKYNLDEVIGSTQIELKTKKETVDFYLKPNITDYNTGKPLQIIQLGNNDTRMKLLKIFLTDYYRVSYYPEYVVNNLLARWQNSSDLTFTFTILPGTKSNPQKILSENEEINNDRLRKSTLRYGKVISENRVWQDKNGLHYRHEGGKIFTLPVGEQRYIGTIDDEDVYTQGEIDLIGYFGTQDANYIWQRYSKDFEGLGLRSLAIVLHNMPGYFAANQEFVVSDKGGSPIAYMVVDEINLCYTITDKGYYFKEGNNIFHLPVKEEELSSLNYGKIKWVEEKLVEKLLDDFVRNFKSEYKSKFRMDVQKKLDGDLRARGIAYKKFLQ